MGIHAIALDGVGRRIRQVDDPSGGSFDAAGDFDRLLDRVPHAVTWSSIDAYGTTRFSRSQAAALLRELPAIFELATDGREQRGLRRLAVLAGLCESGEAMSLNFMGD